MPSNQIVELREKILLLTITRNYCNKHGYQQSGYEFIEPAAKQSYKNDSRFHCQVDHQVANLMTIISPYVDQQEELIEVLQTISGEITSFENECEKSEYTDTGVVWELFNQFRTAINGVVK